MQLLITGVFIFPFFVSNQLSTWQIILLALTYFVGLNECQKIMWGGWGAAAPDGGHGLVIPMTKGTTTKKPADYPDKIKQAMNFQLADYKANEMCKWLRSANRKCIDVKSLFFLLQSEMKDQLKVKSNLQSQLANQVAAMAILTSTVASQKKELAKERTTVANLMFQVNELSAKLADLEAVHQPTDPNLQENDATIAVELQSETAETAEGT